MKRFLTIILAAALLGTGCDNLVRDELASLHSQLDEINSRLDQLCAETNENISALSTIVYALEDNDFVESVTAVNEDGKVIGYEITFSRHGKVVVYNGKDGSDGADGEDGRDGTDGKDGEDGKDGQDGKDGTDGVVPSIGVRQDTDGIWYWVLNGEWLLDQNGQRIRASALDGEDGEDGTDGKSGKDGITPLLKITDGYWYISYDKGMTWTKLGKATGADGTPGKDAAAPESIFRDIAIDEFCITFTLNDGQVITINRNRELRIAFEEVADITCAPGKTVRIAYSISGADSKTSVQCLAEQGWKARIEAVDTQSGYLCATAPNPMVDSKVLVFVNAGDGRTYMACLTFIEGKPMLSETVYYINWQGGEVKVAVRTREDLSVRIPATETWLSLVPQTKAAERVDSLVFAVDTNRVVEDRSAAIELIDGRGDVADKFSIFQYGNRTDSGWIVFQDKEVEKICLTYYDSNGDGHISFTEAASVKSIGTVFRSKTNIKTFDEFKYFTKVETLADEAFKNSSLTRIQLPNSLKVIGASAFYNCKLTSIVLPEGVTAINASAFYHNYYLESIEIPEGVTSLGNECFRDCGNLKSVTLPQSLETIGSGCFRNCSKLSAVTIPSKITVIDSDTFNYCIELAKVKLPDGLIEIGRYAFAYCTSLHTIDVPEMVTSIGVDAFASSGLESFVFPSKIEEVSDYIFNECSNLADVELSPETKKIGKSAFCGCTSLTGIELPETVNSIGKSAFEGSGLKSFTVPSLVTQVPERILYGCASLTEFVMHDDITGIGSGILEGTAVTSFILPPKVTSISSAMLSGCVKLVDLRLHDNVKSISECAFQHCISLESFTLPPMVTAITNKMLFQCFSLKNLALHDNVTSIGTQAFEDCRSLTSFTLPSKVTSIPQSMLKGCYSLADLKIHDKVTAIGSYAFSSCSSLTSFALPPLVKEVPYNMLSNCKSLENLTLHDDVTSIGSSAFENCESLSSFTLPELVRVIEYDTFKGCRSLPEIVLNDEVTSIQQSAFEACESLTSFVVPDKVSALGYGAFRDCAKLQKVLIGSGVTTIGSSTFSGCYRMEELVSLNTTPPTIYSREFDDFLSTFVIKVPASALVAYKTASGWNGYISHIQALPATSE